MTCSFTGVFRNTSAATFVRVHGQGALRSVAAALQHDPTAQCPWVSSPGSRGAAALCGRLGYAFFNAGGSQPWEFQYGTELIQARATGGRGAPFLAINGMSRQELDWGGNFCLQTGWAWRGRRSEKLFRVGFEYLTGSDPQYEFTFYKQNRYGLGMWYDF